MLLNYFFQQHATSGWYSAITRAVDSSEGYENKLMFWTYLFYLHSTDK